MKMKFVTHAALAALMVAAPLRPASAHGGWGHHRDRHDLGIFALGAAVIGATAVVLSAPFNAIAEASAPPPPPYYPPQQQAYYQQAPQTYYAPAPQPYYAPAPVYYAPAPVYYAPRGYYRY